MTAEYRRRERETWEELAGEAEEDGTHRYPNAPSNVRFWTDMARDIEEISKIIETAPMLDERELERGKEGEEGGDAALNCKSR